MKQLNHFGIMNDTYAYNAEMRFWCTECKEYVNDPEQHFRNAHRGSGIGSWTSIIKRRFE